MKRPVLGNHARAGANTIEILQYIGLLLNWGVLRRRQYIISYRNVELLKQTTIR